MPPKQCLVSQALSCLSPAQPRKYFPEQLEEQLGHKEICEYSYILAAAKVNLPKT